MEFGERIAHGYFFAKNYIIKKGYASELDWQDDRDVSSLTEQQFLEQFSWVVLASGMSDKVVRKIFPQVKMAMFNFESSARIFKNKEKCLIQSLKAINHPGKIEAIITAAEYIYTYSFQTLKDNIIKLGVSFIQTFPYMGKATSFHLAKNIGLDIAKPDRHLLRISNLLGYDNPNCLCQDISDRIYEKKSIIDLVLWRYATIDKNYVINIKRFIRNGTD